MSAKALFTGFSRLVFISCFIFLISYFPSVAQLPVTPPDKGRPKTLEISDGLRDYCKLIYACGLKMPRGACPEPGELGTPAPFAPDGERCAESKEFEKRGVGPGHPQWGFRLYRLLGFEYRVTYVVEDTLPISRERLEYLLSDVPLAAKLVTRYQGEPYIAEYTDASRNHFKGSNGKRLRGEARVMAGSYAERRLFYLGQGVAEWGFWTLVGPAIMDFSYWELPGKEKKLGYRVKVLVFPGNGVINSIMNLGLFRNLVHSKIVGVLTDIAETGRKLQANGGRELAQDTGWTASDRKKIEALLALP